MNDNWIEQVLSPESLRKVGFFDPDAVALARAKVGTMGVGLTRTGLEMGLSAVTATQLWHHLYISGGLCDIPTVTMRNSEFALRNGTPASAAIADLDSAFRIPHSARPQ